MPGVKRGDRVSLDTSKRLFFFQEGGIRLVEGQEEVAIIPDNATDEHLKQIDMAIRAGQIIVGWVDKPAVVPESDIDIKALLDGGRNSVDKWLISVRQDKNVKDDVKSSKIEKLIAFEKEGKNRVSVIKSAENALGFIGGVSKVEETDKEKIEIQLTSGNSETEETK